MDKKIFLNESEKRTILKMYGLLNEDASNPKYKVNDTFKSSDGNSVLLLKTINSNENKYNFLDSGLGTKKQFIEWNWSPDIDIFESDFAEKTYLVITKDEYDKILTEFKKSKSDESEDEDETKDEKQEDSSDNEEVTDENWDTLKITGVVKGMTIKGETTIPNILVTFNGEDNVMEQDETDKNGEFEVNLPAVGKYTVSAGKGDKDYNLKNLRYNFIKDSKIVIILEPKGKLLPKIRIFTKKIFNITKNIFTFNDPKQKNEIYFLKKTSNQISYKNSKTQHQYCVNFAEEYYDEIISAYKNSENDLDQTKIPEAKQFIYECYNSYQKTPYKRLLKARAKMNKIYKKLQNLPMTVRKYGF